MRNQKTFWICLSMVGMAGFLPGLSEAQTTTRVSVDTQGGDPNSDIHDPVFSGDRRFVAFESWASNLVAGDLNGLEDVFVYDRQTGTTTRVSANLQGGDSNGRSAYLYSNVVGPSLRGDARYIAFYSEASNLVAGDGNNFIDIFVRDRGLAAVADRGRSDVDGDGKADLLWRSANNG